MFLIAAAVFVIGDQVWIHRVENDRQTINLVENCEKILVFYREDCADCQKVMPQLIRHNLFHQDFIFINMNNSENRHFIKEYELSSVPAFVYKEAHYEGLEKESIKKMVEDRRENHGKKTTGSTD